MLKTLKMKHFIISISLWHFSKLNLTCVMGNYDVILWSLEENGLGGV